MTHFYKSMRHFWVITNPSSPKPLFDIVYVLPTPCVLVFVFLMILLCYHLGCFFLAPVGYHYLLNVSLWTLQWHIGADFLSKTFTRHSEKGRVPGRTWLNSDAPLPRSICTQESFSAALFWRSASGTPQLDRAFIVALWEMAAQCRGVIPEVRG